MEKRYIMNFIENQEAAIEYIIEQFNKTKRITIINVNDILKNAKLHETHSTTTLYITVITEELKRKGYTCAAITEYNKILNMAETSIIIDKKQPGETK